MRLPSRWRRERRWDRTFSAGPVAVKGAHVRNSRGAADRRDLANAVGLVEKVSAVPKRFLCVLINRDGDGLDVLEAMAFTRCSLP